MPDTHIRILLCFTCKTSEELPDFVGHHERDDTLKALTSRHVSRESGEPHRGQMMRVEKKHWDSPSTKAAIEKQIRESTGHTGFDTGYYETKATFQEDAMGCWAKHNRTTDCGDYKTPKMLLMPDTSAERKAEGAGKYKSTTYVCDFCPVQSLVMQANRKRLGAYKK